MTKKVTDIVAYITIIGWLVAFFAGTREESKFHLNQGLVVSVISLIVAVIATVVGFIPVVGFVIGIVAWVLDLGFLALMIIGILNAYNEKEVALPVIGGIKLIG